MIGDKPILALVRRRDLVEIQIHHDRSDPAVYVDAAISDAERLIQQAGRFLAGVAGVEKGRVLDLLSERLQQRDHEIFLRAPEVLRAEFHDLGDAFKGALQLELSVEFDNGRSKSHDSSYRNNERFRASATPEDVTPQ